MIGAGIQRGRLWWVIFACCVAAPAAAMLGVTLLVLDLEHESHALQSRESAIRIALWRMDSWLSPHLGREAARPYFEYLPYYSAETAYTRFLSEIQPGDVLTPSPLLTFESEYFPIHFQVDAGGAVTSPQVPEGNQLDLAEATVLSAGAIAERRERLNDVKVILGGRDLAEACSIAESRLLSQVEPAAPPAQTLAQQEDSGPAQWFEPDNAAWQEMQKRVQSNYVAQQTMASGKGQQLKTPPDEPAAKEHVEIGPLVAIWIDDGSAAGAAEPVLLFVRRVQVNGRRVHQGVVSDWPRLRESLVGEVSDLLPEVRLTPAGDVARSSPQSAHMLASIPAVIEEAAALIEPLPPITPARAALGLMWLALLAAAVASALTLRSSIEFGRRRSRFASAVTHELRTPLTTFQMYSEMLADGMVEDDAQRQLYLQTLRHESKRLAALVENVLAYARVEEGRFAGRPERLTGSELIERIAPDLEERARKSKFELRIVHKALDAVPLEVDVEIVRRILFNLVDNACKYGCCGERREIELTAGLDDRDIIFDVRDFGPGVERAAVRRIFRPFERANEKQATAAPGVGLGLALARELASAIGGSLTHTPPSDGGACFTLRVPRA